MILHASPALTWNNQAPYKTARDALERLHWSVVPLDEDKKPTKTGGFHPDGNPKRLSWKAYQQKHASPSQIDGWQKAYKPVAWAVISGTISNLIILDFDGERGKQILEALGLEPHVRTGSGGYHAYFWHPGWPVQTLNSKSKKELGQRWPGLDIRADGGYAAFCGHNEHGRYEWLREPIPDDLTLLPDELRTFLGLMDAPSEALPSPATQRSPRLSHSHDLQDVLLSRALDRIGALGGRDNAGFWLACQLRDNDFSEAQAEQILLDYARHVPSTNMKDQHEPFTTEEAKAKVKSAYASPAREPWTEQQQFPRIDQPSANNGNNGSGIHSGPSIQVDGDDIKFVLDCLGQDEWGDALLFAHLFQGKAIFDHTAKEWYLYKKHYWQCDEQSKVKHLVSGKLASTYLETAATINLKMKALTEEEDADQLKKLASTIKALTNRALLLRKVARCNNVLTFAASQDGMGVTSDQWDTNKWILPVQNGVVDLRTGQLRDGKPEDYIRTICPTKWTGLNTPAERWEAMFQEIFADRSAEERKALIDFLQRMFGYAITGLTIEQVFLVMYGDEGRNGKDSIIHGISNALGKLAGAISNDVLLSSGKFQQPGSAKPHLVDLQGKRITWASEPSSGAKFDVAQVKQLTGGGLVPARQVYGKAYTFEPTHLLILLTNHKPHADAKEKPFWDRMRLVSFNLRFVDTPTAENERKKDTTLWQKLESEASGILAWLVRGCLQWQEQGLSAPQSVLSAVEEYRQEEDILPLFLEDCCIQRSGLTARAGKLYDKYSEWCKPSHTSVMSRKIFGIEMSKRFEKDKDEKGWFYKGISIIVPDDTRFPDGSLFVPSDATNPHEKPLESDNKLAKSDGTDGSFSKPPLYTREKTENEKLSNSSVSLVRNDTLSGATNPHEKPLESDRVDEKSPVSDPSGMPQNGVGNIEKIPDNSGILSTSPTLPTPANIIEALSAYPDTIEGAVEFIQAYTALGCHVNYYTDGGEGYGVPDQWPDEAYNAFYSLAKARESTLRKLIPEKTPVQQSLEIEP